MSSTHATLEEAVRHHQAGRLDQAESLYREIVRIDPAPADALHLLGVLHCQRRQPDAAIDLIRRAIEIDSSAALYHLNLGTTYRAANRPDDALQCFQRALELDAGCAEACFQIGVLHEQAGQTECAIDYLRRAARLRPDHADSRFRLGAALCSAGRHLEAVEAFLAALQLRPNDANALNSLGSALQKLARLDEAVAAYQAAVRLRPDFGPFHFNLGNALREQDRLSEAAGCYREAVRLAPDDLEARVNLGVTLKEQGALDDAIEVYEEVLRIQPDEAAARFNRALVWLQRGEFAKGWDEYEWRWKHGAQRRTFAEPDWDGTPLAGRSIFIHAEQGIGDEIQFVSCLPDVLSQARQCIVECDPRLVALFGRSFPAAQVVPKPAEGEPPASRNAADVCAATGSLPRFLRRSLDDFPRRAGYLAADADQRADWRRRLDALGSGAKVGISWRGGKEAEARRRRSTELTMWREVLAVPSVHFVGLQYGQTPDELERSLLETGVPIANWNDVDPRSDLDGFAALIAELDLVISVDNSTVHMAGGLGRPVWTLLPFASDWRWLRDRTDSPWYPAMRLFRQERPGDWQALMRQVAGELTNWLERRGG